MILQLLEHDHAPDEVDAGTIEQPPEQLATSGVRRLLHEEGETI